MGEVANAFYHPPKNGESATHTDDCIRSPFYARPFIRSRSRVFFFVHNVALIQLTTAIIITLTLNLYTHYSFHLLSTSISTMKRHYSTRARTLDSILFYISSSSAASLRASRATSFCITFYFISSQLSSLRMRLLRAWSEALAPLLCCAYYDNLARE